MTTMFRIRTHSRLIDIAILAFRAKRLEVNLCSNRRQESSFHTSRSSLLPSESRQCLAAIRSELQGFETTKLPPAEYISLPPMLVNVSPETVVTPESATIPSPAIEPKLVFEILHWP